MSNRVPPNTYRGKITYIDSRNGTFTVNDRIYRMPDGTQADFHVNFPLGTFVEVNTGNHRGAMTTAKEVKVVDD